MKTWTISAKESSLANTTHQLEAKVKDEWSKGYWADYLKANQSAWEVEEKFKEMDEKRLAEIASQTEKETGPTLDQAQLGASEPFLVVL